jgi:hypothetical protein
LFSSANFSYSSHSEKSDNSCSILQSSFTLSRQFIQETKDATCYPRKSFPILLKRQTIFPNLKNIWLVFALNRLRIQGIIKERAFEREWSKQIIHQTMRARISREEREYESKSLICDNSLTTSWNHERSASLDSEQWALQNKMLQWPLPMKKKNFLQAGQGIGCYSGIKINFVWSSNMQLFQMRSWT